MKSQAIKTTFLGCLMFLLCGFNQGEWNFADGDLHLNTDIIEEMTKKQVVTQRARDVVSDDVYYICGGIAGMSKDFDHSLDNFKTGNAFGPSINLADIRTLVSQIPDDYSGYRGGMFAYFDNKKRLLHLDLLPYSPIVEGEDKISPITFHVIGLYNLFICETKENAAFRIEEDNGYYLVSLEFIFDHRERIEHGDQEFLLFLRHELFNGFRGEDWLKDYKINGSQFDVTPIILSYATEGRTLADILNAIQVSMVNLQKGKKHGGDEAQETKKANDKADKNNKETYRKTFKVYFYPHDDTRREYVLCNLIIDIEHIDEPEKTAIKAILSFVYI